jgi:hypothetical protein
MADEPSRMCVECSASIVDGDLFAHLRRHWSRLSCCQIIASTQATADDSPPLILTAWNERIWRRALGSTRTVDPAQAGASAISRPLDVSSEAPGDHRSDQHTTWSPMGRRPGWSTSVDGLHHFLDEGRW